MITPLVSIFISNLKRERGSGKAKNIIDFSRSQIGSKGERGCLERFQKISQDT